MLYIYIATVVVMLLLILFTSLAIITVSKTTGQSIKRKTLKLVSLYDVLLEEHSQELRNTKKLIEQIGYQTTTTDEQDENPTKIEMVTSNASAMSTVENIGKANYLNPQVSEMYQEIRSNFSVDLEEVLERIPKAEEACDIGRATRLLEMLSYENIYAMSFLSEAEQLECMEECLEEESKGILRNYLETRDTFFSLDFYTYLREEAEKENKETTVYISPNVTINQPQSFHVVVSEDICEGIQVEKDHVLYDYAIQKKEIGWKCQH